MKAPVMAAALGGMGVLHFVRPEPFDQLIPPALPASVGQVEAAISGKQPGQILDMAKNNPANTAVVVKQWLKNNA